LSWSSERVTEGGFERNPGRSFLGAPSLLGSYRVAPSGPSSVQRSTPVACPSFQVGNDLACESPAPRRTGNGLLTVRSAGARVAGMRTTFPAALPDSAYRRASAASVSGKVRALRGDLALVQQREHSSKVLAKLGVIPAPVSGLAGPEIEEGGPATVRQQVPGDEPRDDHVDKALPRTHGRMVRYDPTTVGCSVTKGSAPFADGGFH
jgi:hypothetical protein